MNWPVVESSRDICDYYWNCHEQHAQHVCGYCWNCHEYTSIDTYMLCVTDVHSNFLPRLCLQNLFDLAWTSC